MSNGKFQAMKSKNGKRIYIGTFNTKHEAEVAIEKFKKTGERNLKKNERELQKYVYKSRNKWLVQKSINGKKERFGYFEKYEDAVKIAMNL